MARAVSQPLDSGDVRERFVAAGLRVLGEHGAAELTVRRVAALADSSTMGIYSRFGGRAGMLESIYRRGFELLRDALAAAREELPADEPIDRILGLGTAYRRFALGNPALYAFMFERPLPDFDPPAQLRTEALDMTFTLLVAEVAEAQKSGLVAGEHPLRAAYLLWTMTHGIVSIELTHALRTPLPGWFIDTPEVGEQVLRDGVGAVLAGLRPTA